MFPVRRVLREGTTAMFCCVPPRGVSIINITLNNKQYPLINIGSRVKAIVKENLTIPLSAIKVLSLSCTDSTGKMSYAWNYVSCKFELSFLFTFLYYFSKHLLHICVCAVVPPQKPRNLSCVTSDMTTVTCTWDSWRKRDPNDRNKQTYTLHIE